MTGRISSGNARLDAILSGGLPAHGINMLMGLPGSGKTILAQQYMFENASEERPGLYLSTVSEPLEKILRYGQTLSFFRQDLIGRGVFYEDLGPSLVEDDPLGAVLERVVELVRQRRPGVIVIDSFKALRPYADQPGDFRRFLHDLAGHLSVFPATSIWVGEYAAEEIATAPEFAVADTILALATDRAAERETRVLQVLKLRGSGFLSGKHAYRLSADGVDVFPRLADDIDLETYSVDRGRISSGIPLLDESLGDGFWPGASTLVAGPSGTGKTLLGLHFVFNGADAGEPGIVATMQENPTQLERIVNGYGWSLRDGGVDLMYRSPVDLYVDQWVHELLERIDRVGARRVLVDSLGDLRAGSPDEMRFREYLYSLLQRTAHEGVSLMMTQEVPELFGVTKLSEYGISHLSDNVILLQFLRGESRVTRAMTVIKTRASAHDPRIRPFEISANGIEVGDAFAETQSWF